MGPFLLVLSSGVNLIAVRDLPGHSTIKTTERYTHLAPEYARKVTKALLLRDSGEATKKTIFVL